MKFMYDKENGAGPLAVIIFLVAFFLIGLAALFSFIITNKTYEYKINNKINLTISSFTCNLNKNKQKRFRFSEWH